MIEVLAELLFEIVYQVVVQIVFEFLTEIVGKRFLGACLGDADQVSPRWAGACQVLLGLLAGGISLLVFPSRLFLPRGVPGLSLLFAPLLTGFVMMRLGNLWGARRGWRPALLTFQGGALFAFGMAVVRFAFSLR